MSAVARPHDEETFDCHVDPHAGGDDAAASPEESAGYEAVRDSWFEAPPPADPLRSEPPALPASVRELPLERSPADAAFADRMLERLAAGDYAGALLASEALLRRIPRDADALDCAEMSRTELRRVYEARLGTFDRAPAIAMAAPDIAALTLDVFSGVVLSRIDGLTTVQEIAFARGMPADHSLRVLSELYLQGVITL
jgi:hypothetical protein